MASYASSVWPFAHFDGTDDPNFEYVEGAKATDGLGSAGFYPQNSPTMDMLAGVERDAASNLLFKDPVSSRKLVDLLLETDPDSAATTYAVTYTTGKVTQEKWTDTGSGLKIKTIDYTYSGGQISTEVRKVYAANGSTVVAQVTVTYAYSGSHISGSTATRDV
jgi:hypothetical protein